MASVIAPSSPADPTAATDPSDPVDGAVLALARRVAEEEAGSADRVGDFLGVQPEDEVASTLAFAALDPGYRGWRWSVTVAQVGNDAPTISEVLLLPGSDALVPPPWLPWAQRVRGQDVGPGDLHPAGPDDERLVPGYLQSDDPAIEEVALEVGLGRKRVLGFLGRLDAAERWHAGEFGPETPMAEQAPASCISCGFYVPLAGALGAALGACANEFSPADGRVVDAGFGCGAHSETEIDMPMISAAPDVVLDDGVLDVYPRGGGQAGGGQAGGGQEAAPQAVAPDPSDVVSRDLASGEGEAVAGDSPVTVEGQDGVETAEDPDSGDSPGALFETPAAGDEVQAGAEVHEVQLDAPLEQPGEGTGAQPATADAPADSPAGDAVVVDGGGASDAADGDLAVGDAAAGDAPAGDGAGGVADAGPAEGDGAAVSDVADAGAEIDTSGEVVADEALTAPLFDGDTGEVELAADAGAAELGTDEHSAESVAAPQPAEFEAAGDGTAEDGAEVVQLDGPVEVSDSEPTIADGPLIAGDAEPDVLVESTSEAPAEPLFETEAADPHSAVDVSGTETDVSHTDFTDADADTHAGTAGGIATDLGTGADSGIAAEGVTAGGFSIGAGPAVDTATDTSTDAGEGTESDDIAAEGDTDSESTPGGAGDAADHDQQ